MSCKQFRAVEWLKGKKLTHLFVHQPECYSLVSNKSLVVALAIRDALFSVASVRQGMYKVSHVPFIISLMFQKLDPCVRNGHGKPIVEANAAIINRNAEKRHARDIFCNCDERRIERVKGIICLDS